METPQQKAVRLKREADQAQQRATRLAQQANGMTESASGMYGRFEGGQPLLVGHHSYKSAVRDRNRADNATRRSIEARQEAERAQQKADRLKDQAELAARAVRPAREWQRSDFQPGDIVAVRVGPAGYEREDVYRVKRANAKTLTLDGGGGGWDDPKREYARVLSRTRDGITITNPEQENTE